MIKKQTLRGLSTVNFYAQNHDAAKKWYTEFLGIEPYFSAPRYVEFRIGDYPHELGIIDNCYASNAEVKESAGAVVYWHVDDLKTIFDRLISMGAKQYQPITDRGYGFVTASVIDPFGNILGIMTNPHYLDILKFKDEL